jgi:hypothetical protein
MALKQLTVFVENKQGTLVNITDTLAANNVNIRALSIAETDGFGILRLIVDNETEAEKVLTEAGYLIKITEVVGVKIGDAPGKLSYVLRTLADAGINMEYLYAFMARTERHAYVVIRVENNAETEAVLENAGLQDVAPTLAAVLGQEMPQAEGRCLHELLKENER